MPPPTRRQFLSLAAAAALSRAANGAERSEFQLAVTSDEINEDLLTAIGFLKRFDLPYVEIRNLWGRYNTEQPVEKIREARGLLDEHGIKTCILDTGFFKTPLPPETAEGKMALEKQWKILDAAMERAKILGSDRIRVFAFVHKKGEDPHPRHYPRIIELLQEAVRRAKERNVLLALENVGNSYVATAAHSARILKAISDETLGLTWDPNNSAASGDPRPFPDGYGRLDPARIYHVHFRDYRHAANGETAWCGVGQGEFDHVGQLRALRRDGYHGVISLETHFQIDGSKAKASEVSLQGLLRAIQRA